MKYRPIAMYLGGFARIGGIEVFARDFLLAIAPTFPERELVIWGTRDRENRLLEEIVNSGVRVTCSPWRWGCAWNLPDFMLLPQGLAAIRRSSAVVFQRPPPPAALRWLRNRSRLKGRRIPFILVMPYRPAEYWDDLTDSTEIDLFDVITVQSDESVRDLKKLGYHGRVENISLLPPLAIPPIDFPSSRNVGTIRLGYLGRMVPQKNLIYLLDVYRALTRKNEASVRYELHLFGDGPESAELQKKCAVHELTDVTFHGEVSRAEVARAIDSCDLFLITSLTEGQCLVALEVLSRGRSLVATPVGALPDVLAWTEFGRLAPLDAPEQFAACVREMSEAIRSGQVRSESIVGAFGKRYNHDAILERYLQLLRDVGASSAEP